MKNKLSLLLILLIIAALMSCKDNEAAKETAVPAAVEKSIAGSYIGYSWKGESKGTALEDATQKIQTILTLDENGVITDASMLFWKLSGGSWYTRQDSTARISADLSINPVAATPGSDYKKGKSMFTIDTHDTMSLYAVKVETDATTALLIVEPTTRYMYEIKFPSGYDFTTTIEKISVDGTAGGFIPTVRASSSGLIKPASWTELEGMNLLSISPFDHVMVDYGVFKGLGKTTSMKSFLETAGVEFADGKPQESKLLYGRHSSGGWQGNYESIQNFLIGKNAAEMTSLVNWSNERWAKAINADNFFGVDYDANSGATKTAQSSFDTIAGATVRMSRESTSFQRALAAAGVIAADDVIKGRF